MRKPKIPAPRKFQKPTDAIQFVAIIIVGGMGSLAGSAVGAAVWLLLPAIINGFASQAGTTGSALDRILAESKPQLVNLTFGALVILLLIFAPTGLAGIGRDLRDRFSGGTSS